ncbi:glycosyltransferase 2 family protein [Candidatus Magnetomoraceae bacterium gMMP-1]
MNKKASIYFVIGILLSGVALYFCFKNIPFRDIIHYIGSINYWWALASMVVIMFGFLLRVIRWRIILKSISEIDYNTAYHATMIGFMMNCVLPGRVGEVARPIILKKKKGIPFSSGLATVAAERFFDVILLVIFFAVIMYFVDIDPDFQICFGDINLNKASLETIGKNMLHLCLILIVGILLISIPKTRDLIIKIINRSPEFIPFAEQSLKKKIRKRLCLPLINITEGFALGFTLVKNPYKTFICFLLSLIIWPVMALSYYVMAAGCSGISLSFFEMSAVMLIICFFISLPSVPGFWGLWEAGGIFALSIFGISGENAMGFTLINHAVQMIPIILAGLISAVIIGFNIKSYNGKE